MLVLGRTTPLAATNPSGRTPSERPTPTCAATAGIARNVAKASTLVSASIAKLRARIPVTGAMTNLAVPKDMFCAGHVTLADGRVLIMGGTKSFPGLGNTNTNFAGLAASWVFDPASRQFTKLNDAQTGHWYPTLTKLGNGDIWAAGGLDENTNGTVATELFSAAELRWLKNTEVPGDEPAWSRSFDEIQKRNELELKRMVTAWRQLGRPAAVADARYPRTTGRLCLMWDKLESEGFTSFWM